MSGTEPERTPLRVVLRELAVAALAQILGMPIEKARLIFGDKAESESENSRD